jgi:hypothetical protein
MLTFSAIFISADLAEWLTTPIFPTKWLHCVVVDIQGSEVVGSFAAPQVAS